MRWFSIAIAALALSGCAAPYQEPEVHTTRDGLEFPSPVWTVDGLYLVGIPGPGALFVTLAPTDLRGYTGVLIDKIWVSSADDKRDLYPWMQERIAAACRRALLRVFADAGWQIVDAPDVDVFKVRLVLRNVEVSRISLPAGGYGVFNPGRAMKITLELRDSVEQRRLLLLAEERALPSGLYHGPGRVGFERVKRAFGYFATDLQRHLEAAVHGDLPSPKAPPPTSR
jgi:hypothetical protein